MKSEYPETEYPEKEGSPEIIAALRALADFDRDQEASQIVEARLIQTIRAANRERMWRRRTTYGLAAAAGFAILWISSIYRSSLPVATESQLPSSESKEVAVESPFQQQPLSPVPAETAPAPIRRPRRAKLPPVLAETGPREIMTEFFPLMDSPPPFERGELVRMTVPAAAMRKVGLPISPDRWGDSVQADVLLGQEGMPRAIRFVRYEQ